MLLTQKGVCAVCGLPETTITRGYLQPLAVDHDHSSGKIRGLLCVKCNTALGLLKDSKERIKTLLEYIENAEMVEPTS